jgi:hypothetical protein
LAKHCALSPHGLCFVTDEERLVPRRDLHEEMNAAMRAIEQASHDQCA